MDFYISGDFFFFPASTLVELEKSLEGVASETKVIETVVEHFYQQHSIESPGVIPADFANVLTV
jgi:hypothetical protein